MGCRHLRAIALVISLWVSLRFVPRLAKSVEWDWIPFLSHYHVTREGWIYFGSLVVVVFAAINTNNNLLYMVLSALLAVLLLSGFLSSVNFRSVDIRIRVPATCFAGESFPVSIEMRNAKSVFPTFSLKVGPANEHKLQFDPVYLTCLRAKETDNRISVASLNRRGRYTISKVKMTSRYPFGFLSKEKDRATKAACVCYPEIVAKEQLNFAAIDLLGANQRFERGPGNDLYMIRDYLPSDSARHVHWKASAKTAVLKTESSRRKKLDEWRCTWIVREARRKTRSSRGWSHTPHRLRFISFVTEWTSNSSLTSGQVVLAERKNTWKPF